MENKQHPAYVFMLEHALRFGMHDYLNDLLEVDKNILASLAHTEPFLWCLRKGGTWFFTVADLKANKHTEQAALKQLARDYPSDAKGLYLHWDGYQFFTNHLTLETFSDVLKFLVEA